MLHLPPPPTSSQAGGGVLLLGNQVITFTIIKTPLYNNTCAMFMGSHRRILF